MLRNRGFIVLVCVAVLLAAAMAPLSDSPCAILVPLGPLFGMVVSVPLDRTDAGYCASLSEVAHLPSRAPPAA